jgi:hypothetical protein
MSQHRFRDFLTPETSDRAAAPSPMLGGFIACPIVLQGAGGGMADWQRELYRWAFEQARAVLNPSIHEGPYAPSRN